MRKTIELHKRWRDDPAKGEVFTPEELVKEMLDKIPTSVWENPTSTFLDPCMGKGTFLIDILRRLTTIYGYSVEDAMSRIYGYDVRVKYINYLKRGGFKNVFHKDFLNEKFSMKFDVVLGNPPYGKDNGASNSTTLWDKFIFKGVELLNKGGYISMVHPGSWRSGSGEFIKVKNILTSLNMTYLNMCDYKEGLRVFNQQTNFDWYVVKNEESTDLTLTKVCDYDNNVVDISLKNLPLIPSSKIDTFFNYISLNEVGRVDFINDSSYHTQRNWVSKVSDNVFRYPCVYSISESKGVQFRWSSDNSKGHFGKSKIIWTNGSKTKPILDIEGNYGLTEFACAIFDTPENLIKIKKVLESNKFIDNVMFFRGRGNVYDKKIIKLLKKDFWREFINE
jgi:hypothetical protein